uniref:GBD/FH3 domain-containing protein n=1 Tax=Timema monikensis TaxID=170555 RepID=A0A7R9HK17_9NEOP|nr:unnamed protein product [Timema monikensis]
MDRRRDQMSPEQLPDRHLHPHYRRHTHLKARNKLYLRGKDPCEPNPLDEVITGLTSTLLSHSFVQEFVGDPLDGVTLLLELLRAVQLSQAAQQARCPPPLLRRVLLDEHSCLQCLKSCLRCPDAARRLSSSPAGLFTLAVCIMSNVSKSRVVALEVRTCDLLTRACEPPGCGHTPVSEALSTLRLRFGEPVRFRFLVGMLISAGGCPELQAAGLRFLNTFLDTAPSQQHRLYLQAELEQAGFTTAAIRKKCVESSRITHDGYPSLEAGEAKQQLAEFHNVWRSSCLTTPHRLTGGYG